MQRGHRKASGSRVYADRRYGNLQCRQQYGSDSRMHSYIRLCQWPTAYGVPTVSSPLPPSERSGAGPPEAHLRREGRDGTTTSTTTTTTTINKQIIMMITTIVLILIIMIIQLVIMIMIIILILIIIIGPGASDAILNELTNKCRRPRLPPCLRQGQMGPRTSQSQSHHSPRNHWFAQILRLVRHLLHILWFKMRTLRGWRSCGSNLF